MLKIAYHPIYKHHLPDGHRFPMEKYDLLPQQLVYEGTCNEDNFFEPEIPNNKYFNFATVNFPAKTLYGSSHHVPIFGI